jgi:N-acetyl-alpha-D-muramate 1-phosphate uridylyltransferase
MRAMVLAAGRGERMGALTQDRPKPLLRAGGKALIDYTLEALARAGVHEVVVNHAYLGEQVIAHIADGARFGLCVSYSPETDGALETGGGLMQALPLLGPDPFIAVNADVFSDFDFTQLPYAPKGLAHLVLVPNPTHHRSGDFGLEHGYVNEHGTPRHTFSGIGVYRPELWRHRTGGHFPLGPLLRETMSSGGVTGQLHDGIWNDIGTPERLDSLDASLRQPDWS